MPVNAIIGLQRGDEGKGRFVDMLAEHHDIVARFNGGNNAGHTVIAPDDTEYDMHICPSGVVREHTKNVIGNGVFVNPEQLVEEIAALGEKGVKITEDNLLVSNAAHLILPQHISEDEIREKGIEAQGSTKTGIAQVAGAKVMRYGVRMELINNDLDGLEDLVYKGLVGQRQARREAGLPAIDVLERTDRYIEAAASVGNLITDTVLFINNELTKPDPSHVLAEGAQGFLLDIDQGMHPYVTSSHTIAGAVCTGLGVSPEYIEAVVGVAKAVPSHVGGGPFVTEILDEDILKVLHGDLTARDAETGTTTGRTRRLGYYDLPQIRRALMVNGSPSRLKVALTKLDWVPRYGKDIDVCVAYKRKGKYLEVAPDAAYKLEQSTPVYQTLSNWHEDISEVREFEDLPGEAKNYIEFLEENTGYNISMIGVGPRRDQVIIRN